MSLFAKLRRRAHTQDRGAPIHTTEQIGPKRHLTPEGFLFCEDVPIARVGTLVYAAGEIPAQPGPDGLIYVTRTEEELFHPDHIASYHGKDVVDEHPSGGVTTGNYNSVSVGVTLNPRRGEGEDSDVLLVDLLIKEAGAIRAVNANKREVSAGYEADYRQKAPGLATQSAIIGNHVALVEKGRCGPRCAIGDHSHDSTEGEPMPTTTIPRRPVSRATGPQTPTSQAVRAIFRDAEAAALEALSGEGGSDGTDAMAADNNLGEAPTGGGSGDIHIHLPGASAPTATTDEVPGAAPAGNDLEARVGALEAGVAKIIQLLEGNGGAPAAAAPAAPPAKTGDEAPPPKEGEEATGGEEPGSRAATGDSAALETGFKEMVSAAEILLPGVSLPTFDGKTTRAKTMDSMCAFRRRVLDGVMLTTDGATMIRGLAEDGLDLAKATCSEVAMLFKAAAAAKGQSNNRSATGDSSTIPNQQTETRKSSAPKSIAELNAFNRKHYAGS